MRLLHGDPAALERSVARVCATDMPDPRPFVTAGALVCTGLVWRRDPADSDHYVGMLARSGVAGVVAGQALHGHVPDDVVAACARSGLPLLSAPQSVPFSRIIEHLAEQAAELRWQRVQSRVDRQRRLMAAVAAGSGIGDLLADISSEQDVPAWLVTATGRVIAGSGPLSDEDLDRIIATALGAPRLPAVTAGALRIFQVGNGDRITAWYLVIRPTTDTDSSGADLAAIAELYRQRAADRLHLDWELGDRLPRADRASVPTVAVVAEIHPTAPVPPALAATPNPGPSPRAARLPAPADRVVAELDLADDRSGDSAPAGHEPGGGVRDRRNASGAVSDPDRTVCELDADRRASGAGAGAHGSGVARGLDGVVLGGAAVSSRGAGEVSDGAWVGAVGVDGVRAALHDVLPDASTSIDRDGRLVAVAAGTQDEIVGLLRKGIGRLSPVLAGVRLALGVSARQRDESLSGAIAAAAAAAATAHDDDAVVSVRPADIDSAVGLFTAVPGGLQRRFAERVLGPVVEYDRRTGAGLLETLEVFLGCEGSWRQAAERMHLHLNTVRYRIGRVEELTGRDLGRLDDRLDLYLAVRTLSGQTAPV
ncbi:PucR family transcriptional regulator [Nocardia crassostreae]|uniref:PucR family transcriptional regulator n=1 Tax=Nocardia crassostreae TaxID=53428 RepID=UPI00082E6272|nr:PucR family transcriptional regulator [Nocardia crassostreae]